MGLTGAAEPTVGKSRSPSRTRRRVEAAKREERLRRRTVDREESSRLSRSGLKDDNASSSTKTRVRLAYRSPLKLAGLHPVIRALEMGRRRRFVDDRASVEIRRARSPAPTDVNGNHRVPRKNGGARTRSTFWTRAPRRGRRARRFQAVSRTRWREARSFETGRSNLRGAHGASNARGERRATRASTKASDRGGGDGVRGGALREYAVVCAYPRVPVCGPRARRRVSCFLRARRNAVDRLGRDASQASNARFQRRINRCFGSEVAFVARRAVFLSENAPRPSVCRPAAQRARGSSSSARRSSAGTRARSRRRDGPRRPPRRARTRGNASARAGNRIRKSATDFCHQLRLGTHTECEASPRSCVRGSGGAVSPDLEARPTAAPDPRRLKSARGGSPGPSCARRGARSGRRGTSLLPLASGPWFSRRAGNHGGRGEAPRARPRGGPRGA